MGKLVGRPAAIAAKMILSGKNKEGGGRGARVAVFEIIVISAWFYTCVMSPVVKREVSLQVRFDTLGVN